MTPLRSFETPRESDLGLRRIGNPSGLSIGILPNGCVFAVEHRHEPEMHRRLIQEYQVHEALRVGQRAESIRRPSSVHELVPATPSRRGARGSGAPVQ